MVGVDFFMDDVEMHSEVKLLVIVADVGRIKFKEWSTFFNTLR